jgi:biopolymer transport protein ExbD
MNDQQLAMEEVSQRVSPLYLDSDQHLIISVRADRETPYSYIDAIQKEMVAAGVVRVVFATQLERQMTRAVR